MTTKGMDADHSHFFSDRWTWEDILGRIVTRDEIWVFLHISESKAESRTWMLPGSCVETIQDNDHLLGIAYSPFSSCHSLQSDSQCLLSLGQTN